MAQVDKLRSEGFNDKDFRTVIINTGVDWHHPPWSTDKFGSSQSPTGGFVGSYSNLGPTFGGELRPQFGAPVGNVLPTDLLFKDGYTVKLGDLLVDPDGGCHHCAGVQCTFTILVVPAVIQGGQLGLSPVSLVSARQDDSGRDHLSPSIHRKAVLRRDARGGGSTWSRGPSRAAA
ncbi:hypothetical protein CH63R_07854 [Colletotrichum higginsianum IMI 349063]|uniref:Uncharacterized protein n=1 Tax=Colletotrichum higginsianum (strain IMI 349063) TaxID=759273 RepID=A0A1B7YAN8_COLHI|nr:hypothetical protein CH63R_07854 [Colletotrichum higginsianum IMI 349063]OBR09089.1 hypothetical protein CH63R_07854 [Colletotrichum higginsianum IMI 349063]